MGPSGSIKPRKMLFMGGVAYVVQGLSLSLSSPLTLCLLTEEEMGFKNVYADYNVLRPGCVGSFPPNVCHVDTVDTT